MDISHLTLAGFIAGPFECDCTFVSANQAHKLVVTVGTPVTRGPPHRSRRAALPHRAPALGHGVKPLFGPRMRDLRSRKPAFRNPVHPFPGDATLLTTSP